MVWKFCGKAKFPHSFGAFPQNFHTVKLSEITVFYVVLAIEEKRVNQIIKEFCWSQFAPPDLRNIRSAYNNLRYKYYQ